MQYFHMFLDFVYEYVEIIPRSSHISSENYLKINETPCCNCKLLECGLAAGIVWTGHAVLSFQCI